MRNYFQRRQQLKKYNEILKALGDETRLRILYLLIKANGELCCCELTNSLEEPQYNISRHLKILKNAQLIEDRKEGRWVYSYVPKGPNKFIGRIIETISSLPETQQLKQDRRNLKKRLKLREGDKCVVGIQKSHLLRKIKNER